MGRRGAKRTRDEAKGGAVAPLEQTPARGEVTTATDAAVRPAAVSHDVVARASRGWTLDSPVEDVLMERCCGLGDMSLHDFLMKHFGETLGSPCDSMRVFMDDPTLCVSDEAVLRRITNSSPYREYELYKTRREGVDRLSARGIFSLLQWGSAAAANEVEGVGACVRGVLNAALAIATGICDAPSGLEIDGEYDAACDAYIRRENLRVWHIVEKNIGVWLRDRGYVHPFIVIGTSGIGKSFATGSLLLYQLLHYRSRRLKVVAYFVEGKAYISYREERRVVFYKEQQVAVDEIEDMIRRGVKGYVIFDISGSGAISDHLPRSWGIVLISSPNAKNFHEFAKQLQDTAPTYMNCYEDVDFKAALVWDRQSQLEKKQIELENTNLASD
ncbi:unnamed protein product [Trypanosoma congolense IL3000]|uniref:WGS project CAEQ00000000 data, annotated contig 1094 n=1 Tax=Trypanosoma congolense (strain IL3000) TaxID=1068625 RepID=F9W3R3_TRYCI|nr:unnamed protein product [Trypanosoma congolense IL3000]